MNAIVFEAPERRTTEKGEPFFVCKLAKPGYAVPHDLEWQKDALVPAVTVQKLISELRSTVLKLLMENKSLFRNPPTLDSLQAITPPWGILIRGAQMEWSTVNKWELDANLQGKSAIVRLILTGIEISRSYINPVWGISVVQILPEKPEVGIIDFEFGEAEVSDVKSVTSEDFDRDDSDIVALHKPGERKAFLKSQVRELLAKVAEARMAADDAMDRFFDEFDLSEGESDFSDTESESE